jgi:hypothetical protein
MDGVHYAKVMRKPTFIFFYSVPSQSKPGLSHQELFDRNVSGKVLPLKRLGNYDCGITKTIA